MIVCWCACAKAVFPISETDFNKRAYFLTVISCSISISAGSRIARAYGKKVAKDARIFDLLPHVDYNKYLIPDFQDVVEAYLATRPNSEERTAFVDKQMETSESISKVFPCH